MSLVLAIDTVTHLCSCALYAQEVCLARQCDDIGKGHGEHLIGQIELLLRQAGVGTSAIDRIAVNTGPGSFTGMRVGVATARGLGLALGINAIGVSRFEAIAYGLRKLSATKSEQFLKSVKRFSDKNCGKNKELEQLVESIETKTALECKSAVILSSVQDLVSLQLFDMTGAALTPPYQEKAEKVAAQLPKPIVLSGDGYTKIAAILKHDDVEIFSLTPEVELDGVAAIARACPLPQPPPSPLYLRAPDAKPMAGGGVAN